MNYDIIVSKKNNLKVIKKVLFLLKLNFQEQGRALGEQGYSALRKLCSRIDRF